MKSFLTKDQKKDLKAKGWDLIPTKSNCMWFGQDWDCKHNALSTINDIIDLDGSEETQGYNFLIIGYKKEQYNED
tara:strand:+ start:1660 stop:1884 length:225 start_codon:yes stop_codon:yes gene_type:complete